MQAQIPEEKASESAGEPGRVEEVLAEDENCDPKA